jgi:hypothetical protein
MAVEIILNCKGGKNIMDYLGWDWSPCVQVTWKLLEGLIAIVIEKDHSFWLRLSL